MSSLKVIQVQAKSIKVTCSSSCGGVGRSNFTSSKTHSDYGKDLDTLIDSAMANAQKLKRSLSLRLRTNSNWAMSWNF